MTNDQKLNLACGEEQRAHVALYYKGYPATTMTIDELLDMAAQRYKEEMKLITDISRERWRIGAFSGMPPD